MSTTINVRLIKNDQFEVTNPVTSEKKVFSSGILHTPKFIAITSVKDFFCSEFGATGWNCSADALERIQQITDFNCINDEVRF